MRITSVNRSAVEDEEPTITDLPTELNSIQEKPFRTSSAFERAMRRSVREDAEMSIQSSDIPLVLADPPNYEHAMSKDYEDMELTELEEARRASDAAKMAANMAAVGRLYGQGMQNKDSRRLVQKAGECNVVNRNVTKRHRSYLVDIFTTLVDMRWRLHAVLFASAFVITWCTFAIVWWIIAIAHGDSEVPMNDTQKPCVDNVFNYRTALLFSIETQHTIGYGFRAITDECWYAVIVLMLQSCVGVVVQTLITGIVFAKISRPKGRAQTIMFSHKAVISQRDGEYYLLFRVGDMRKSHIIGTSMRALLVKNHRTREGESIPLCQYPLTLETDTSHSDSFIFMIWPITVQHKIDKESPLWDLSAEKLYKEHFEIIVILEGTIESTGNYTQVRTSYIPREIAWGERLVPLLTFQLENGRYEIDYGQFHNTLPMMMLNCSAKTSAEMDTSGRAARSREKDYPINFTAPMMHEVPTHRTIYGLFHRNNRPPVTGDRTGNVKRKAVAVRDRKISEDETRRQEIEGSINRIVNPIGDSLPEAMDNKHRWQIMKNTAPNRKSCTLPSRAPFKKERRNAIDLYTMTVSGDGGNGWNEAAVSRAAEGRSLDKIFPKTRDSRQEPDISPFKRFEDPSVENHAFEMHKETDIGLRPPVSRFVVSPAKDDSNLRPVSSVVDCENNDNICINKLYDGHIDYNVKSV